MILADSTSETAPERPQGRPARGLYSLGVNHNTTADNPRFPSFQKGPWCRTKCFRYLLYLKLIKDNYFANTLCPPTVLSVSDGIIEIPVQGVSVGKVVDVVDGNSLVAEIIVYEMNANAAKCKVDPKGSYTSASIKEGMSVKTTTKNGKIGLNNINKAKK